MTFMSILSLRCDCLHFEHEFKGNVLTAAQQPSFRGWILRHLSGRTLEIRWFKVRLQGAQLNTNMHLVQHSFKRSRSVIVRRIWVLEHFFTPVRCPASIPDRARVKKLLMMSKLSPRTQILRLCPSDGDPKPEIYNSVGLLENVAKIEVDWTNSFK